MEEKGDVMTSKVNMLIVEDEVLLANDLAIKLSKQYNVLTICASMDEAVAVLNEATVDLALIDIELKGDQDGIDLAILINEKHPIPFIFLSSHSDPQTVERAKLTSPNAYLLKPYNERELFIAIELALTNYSLNMTVRERQSNDSNNPEESQVLKINDSLFLKKDTHFERVAFSDIYFLEADSNYTTIYTKSTSYIYSRVLKKMEEKLPQNQFLRIHRSFIVNTQAVTGFEGNLLEISGGKKIPVSKQYREVVFQLFEAF